jgi:hypothetical protein
MEDELDRARHTWRKGRFEFMGGPVFYEQDGLNNNERTMSYTATNYGTDPVARKLQVDQTEQ